MATVYTFVLLNNQLKEF